VSKAAVLRHCLQIVSWMRSCRGRHPATTRTECVTRVCSLYFLRLLGDNVDYAIGGVLFGSVLAYAVVFLGLTRTVSSIPAYQVAIRSLGLGLVFGIAILVSLLAPLSVVVFGWYMCLLSFFHFSEYLTTALINPRSLSLDSFLINHSREYTIAAVLSWTEFWLEWLILPELKQIFCLSILGVMLCVGGEFIRKLAMFTAKTNFSHVIQVHKEEGHVLVTNGIYRYWRHPSYVGWFWWSVGTQIVLCNPLCLCGYIVASWNFFNERIMEEEIILLNFFGEDYLRYQKTVPTGLPFITGFRVEL